MLKDENRPHQDTWLADQTARLTKGGNTLTSLGKGSTANGPVFPIPVAIVFHHLVVLYSISHFVLERMATACRNI
jgi:hypothetical protein